MIEIIPEIIAWISWPFGVLLFGVSAGLAFYYVHHHHRNYPHIVRMAVSYSILVALCVASINYRVFYSGTSRAIAAVVMFLAFLVGFDGLRIIYKWRATDLPNRQ